MLLYHALTVYQNTVRAIALVVSVIYLNTCFDRPQIGRLKSIVIGPRRYID